MRQNPKTGLGIRLLGGFEVTWKGMNLAISGRKSQGLLAVLALSQNGSAARERLAHLLWSDRDDTHARNSLRQALAALKKDLAVTGAALLETERDQVMLVEDLVWVDVAAFRSLAAAAGLEKAKALYRGPLLDQVSIRDQVFEDWVAEERRWLADEAYALYEKIFAAATRKDRTEEARALLRLDPLREEGHRAVMCALAETGARDQALRQYQMCRDLLKKEMDVAPSPETDALKARIESGEGDPGPPSLRQMPQTTADQSEPEDGDEPTIAVLAFKNQTTNPDYAFLADGMTGSIISTLTKVPYIRVTSVRGTPDKGEKDALKAGREQGARYVLEGSVTTAGERVRITARVSDCRTGQHVWTELYDRTLGDVFALQDEITKAVALALQVKFSAGEMAITWAGGPKNFKAWELVLQAVTHLSEHKRNARRTAERLVEEAIRNDPGYSAAWTVSGWLHWEDVFCGWTSDPQGSLDKAQKAANEAKRLSPADPEPYCVLAMCGLQRGDFKAAEAEMAAVRNRGLNHYMVPAIDANVAMFSGRAEAAIPLCKEAMRLAPMAPPYVPGDLGQASLQLGRYDDAVHWSRISLRRSKDYIHAHVVLVISLWEQGKADEARAAAAALLESDPAFSVDAWANALPYKDRSINKRFGKALKSAGLPD